LLADGFEGIALTAGGEREADENPCRERAAKSKLKPSQASRGTHPASIDDAAKPEPVPLR